jgi:maleate isomerase
MRALTGGRRSLASGILYALMAHQAVIDDLLETTGASRTTLRLDTPGDVFPVVAEAVAPGIRSIKDEKGIDLKAAATFQFLEHELRPLIQNDCSSGDNPPPPELIALYGVHAQMLGPVVRDGRLVGIVSVHYAPSPREWSEADVAALEHAVARIQSELRPG